MLQIITVDADKCVGCSACVRVCPVHANITKLRDDAPDSLVTTVDYTACINCGECVKACKHDARGFNDNIDKFTHDFEAGMPMTIVVAPAVRTSFPNGKWKALLKWIRDNGNCSIYDVGYGADICTYMHAKYLEQHPGARLMTQPCPAIVNYVQMYKSELIRNLSPVLSPAGCMGAYLRSYANDRHVMYMLSPCLAKTSEAQREKIFDFNVTFKHLEEYVSQKNIDWRDQDFEFDTVAGDEAEGSIGRIYPMPGGLKETLLMLNRDLVIRTAEGPHTVYDRLDRYARTADEYKPDVLDVLNCESGCNHGTATPDCVATLMDVETIMDQISSSSVKELAGNRFGFGRMKRFKSFEKTLDLKDFLTSYTDKRVDVSYPNTNELNAIFDSMHKTDVVSRCVDCSACGYKSCHDMAVAIYRGMNVKESCVYYLKHSIMIDYDSMRDVHAACTDSINMLNEVCNSIRSNQTDVTSAATLIEKHARDLIDNIDRLQSFSQTCIDYYSKVADSDLTVDDFGKMKQFISAICTMAASYREMTQKFIEQSLVITDRAGDLESTVDGLVTISNDLNDIISTDGGAA